MVTVSEATAIIFNNLFVPATTRVKLEGCIGKILAEGVTADRDFPPFNRVSMDGIAIQGQEWMNGQRSFIIEGMQAAGEKQTTLSDPAHCVEVMTGAVLPEGCDAVVRYEDLKINEHTAVIETDQVALWQSIHRQGMDAKKGEILLGPGQILAPSEVALLASTGHTEVSVFNFPKVAIISTGDELVDIGEIPLPWQIRRSNSYALQAALQQMGLAASCFHLNDERAAMTESLDAIAGDFDVLILSGGVSRGKFDFVPQVLEDIGIQKQFHQVSQRPGKPFWFGRSAAETTAFALPGNPVSTFMCFYRYVKPWIMKSLGAPVRDSYAVLASDFSFQAPLTCFLQVSISNEQGRMLAYPVPGGGSGDFANLKNVDGFLELPLEKNDFKAGEVFPYFAFRH